MAAFGVVVSGVAVADSGNPPAGGYVPVSPATKVLSGSIAAGKSLSGIAVGGATLVPTNATAVKTSIATKATSAGTLTVFPASDSAAPDSQNVSYTAGTTNATIETTPGTKDEITIHNGGAGTVTVTVDDVGYSTELTATNIAPDAGTSGQVLTDTGTGAAWQTRGVTVNPGTGLTGGGSISLGGSSTLSVDPTAVQSRVSGTCDSGGAISKINQDGTVGCASPAAGWSLTGNAGTTATDFLGTTDNSPLSFDVNGQRAFELEPNVTSPVVLGGFSGNSETVFLPGATISGGGESSAPNAVSGAFGTVAGGFGNTAAGGATASGENNTAGGLDSTALGNGNTASGGGATALGVSNTASFLDSTALGELNTSSGQASTALGQSNTSSGGSSTALGKNNNATGAFSTALGFDNSASAIDSVALGGSNAAAGIASVAAGLNANDPSGDNDAFVWSDGTLGSSNQQFSATASKQFDALATGGFNMQLSAPGATFTGCTLTSASGWACSSDRNAKHAFRPVSDRQILNALAGMPIDSWSYKIDRTGTRHIGPTAQDFLAAFHVGSSPRLIGNLDEGGVALAGVQGLYRLLLQQQRQITRLETQLAKLQGSRRNR